MKLQTHTLFECVLHTVFTMRILPVTLVFVLKLPEKGKLPEHSF